MIIITVVGVSVWILATEVESLHQNITHTILIGAQIHATMKNSNNNKLITE